MYQNNFYLLYFDTALQNLLILLLFHSLRILFPLHLNMVIINHKPFYDNYLAKPFPLHLLNLYLILLSLLDKVK